ncbi:hypothetical protein ENUP19_0253G0021 [Entamoeba nuttalli]|uniref:Uncharacterized protein n=2 Tax=Entamoeba nuttalli TaxID=412467 RepID=K2H1A3_ENTNP|nr:hypothetical protein ENU1_103610 [Entamoeba nuttalli P19]EKE40057.1 hypothetical protein ENU1_103610 [Entamoeba nuttalli P19]|eukprot:XP_008857604.1 hypothetical protein ENU1_103610 [Entamoeba nuttalli P19]
MSRPISSPTPLRPTTNYITKVSRVSEDSLKSRKIKLLSALSTPGNSNAKPIISVTKMIHLNYLPIFTSYLLPLMNYINNENRPQTELENDDDFINYKKSLEHCITSTYLLLSSMKPSPVDTMLTLFTPLPPILQQYNTLSQDEQFRIEECLHELLRRIYVAKYKELCQNTISQLTTSVHQLKVSYYAKLADKIAKRKIEIQNMQKEIEILKQKLLTSKEDKVSTITQPPSKNIRTITIPAIGEIVIYGYCVICKLPGNTLLHLIYSSLVPEDCNSFIKYYKNLKNCKVELNGRYRHLMLFNNNNKCFDENKIAYWVLENPNSLEEKYRYLVNYFNKYVNFIKVTRKVRSELGAYFVKNNDRPTLKIPIINKDKGLYITVEFEFDGSRIEQYNELSDPFRPVRTRINVITGTVSETQVKNVIDISLKDNTNNWLSNMVMKLSSLY